MGLQRFSGEDVLQLEKKKHQMFSPARVDETLLCAMSFSLTTLLIKHRPSFQLWFGGEKKCDVFTLCDFVNIIIILKFESRTIQINN